jgi:predicted oxidoreductase (fatty acid repression mutant protein)
MPELTLFPKWENQLHKKLQHLINTNFSTTCRLRCGWIDNPSEFYSRSNRKSACLSSTKNKIWENKKTKPNKEALQCSYFKVKAREMTRFLRKSGFTKN